MEYSELKCPICGNTSVQKLLKNDIEELISLNFCELSDKRYDDVIIRKKQTGHLLRGTLRQSNHLI